MINLVHANRQKEDEQIFQKGMMTKNKGDSRA
jgi:hypothetical protein